MKDITFFGKVAVITGSARGLGREYVKILAAKGASVVINDIAVDSVGTYLADRFAEEITGSGGCALVNHDNIATKDGAASLVKAAVEKFGKVDVFVHNAGIVRDMPFVDMKDEDWYGVLDVHLNGAYHLLKNIVPLMIENNYGRIVLVTSSVGMYGLKNHLAYGAAKMGVFGLAKSLKSELEGYNIKCNLLSPLASTGQTQYAISGDIYEDFKPDRVAPMVGYICSDRCSENGRIFVASAGYFSMTGFFEGKGIYIPFEELTVESISEKIPEICDLSNPVYIASTNQAGKKLFRGIRRKRTEI